MERMTDDMEALCAVAIVAVILVLGGYILYTAVACLAVIFESML